MKKEKKEKKQNETLEKIKFYYNKLKEFLSNRRYRSLTILAIYIIFFVIVFSLIDKDKMRENYENQNIEATQLKASRNLFRLTNYQFNYKISILDTSDNPIKNFNINGKTYGSNTFLMIDETKESYFIENKDIYLMNNGVYEKVTDVFFDFSKITPDNIYKYLGKAEKESSTTFNSGYKKEVYKITAKEFAKIYMNEDIQNNNLLYINVYYYKDKIKVELNLGLYNNLKIDMEYTKMNEIKKFTKDDTLAM